MHILALSVVFVRPTPAIGIHQQAILYLQALKRLNFG
jgi:hypothetical protein